MCLRFDWICDTGYLPLTYSGKHCNGPVNSIQIPVRAEELLSSYGEISVTKLSVWLTDEFKYFLTLYGPCVVIYLRNRNQSDALSFLIYSNNYPLHVPNRLTIHHQEAVYCICRLWYISCWKYRVSRGSVPDFGRMFLTLKYTDITQNTYIQS